MSEEQKPEGASDQAPPREESAEPGAFDMSQRKDFGGLLAVLGILALLGAGALVFSGKFGKLGGGSASLPEGVIAKVGDKEVPLDEFRSWVTSLPQSVHVQLVNPDFRRKLLDSYLDRIALIVYGKGQGIYETDAYKEALEEQRRGAGLSLMLDEIMREQMIPELLESYYKENRDKYPLPFEDQGQRYQMIRDYQRKVIAGLAEGVLKNATLDREPDLSKPVVAHMIFGDGQAVEITLEDFETEAASYPENQRAWTVTPDGRREVLERMYREKALIQLARSRGYMERPEVERQLQELRPHLIAKILAEDALGDMEAGITRELQEHRAEYERTSMELAHILVRLAPTADPATEGKARERIDEIYKEVTAPKGDFAEVAKRRSEDPGSASKGGALGEISADQLVKPFADAAFGLGEGQISEPVRTMFGWHVIKALSAPKTEFKEELARITARRKLIEQAMDEQLKAVRQKVGIIISEENFAKWGADAAPPRPADVPPSMEELQRQAEQQ